MKRTVLPMLVVVLAAACALIAVAVVLYLTRPQQGAETVLITIPEGSWSLSPETIELAQGETQTITIVNEDSYAHGFAVRELNINEYIPEKGIVSFSVTPEEKGTFVSYCSVSCGGGHLSMRGKVLVR